VPTWNSIWPWLVAAVVTLISGALSALMMMSWYLSSALALPELSFSVEGGTTVVGAPPTWATLPSALVPTLVLVVAGSVTGLALFYLLGRRTKPALVAVVIGPALGLAAALGGNIYTLLVDVKPGDVYLGTAPHVLVGFVLIAIVPAVTAGAVVLRAARRSAIPAAPGTSGDAATSESA
jgi:hypothetical protein